MKRYMAFLRGVNVGGHTVKNDQLRLLFGALGLEDVTTFIASGNVVFRSSKQAATLEREISAHLGTELGYDVAVFVRTDAEVAAIAAHDPFPKDKAGPKDSLHVGFLHKPLPAAAVKAVAALAADADTDTDAFAVDGRELYWRIRGGLTDSAVGDRAVLKALGVPTTLRNMNTIRRMADKYPPD